MGTTDPAKYENYLIPCSSHHPAIEIHADTDAESRLLYQFIGKTAELTFINFQVFARKWHNFSERQPDHANPTLLPGVLRRLPPEIRLIIYDFLMPAMWTAVGLLRPLNTLSKDLFGHITRQTFTIPKIAHVCREMRQYAMRKYQFIWLRYTVTPEPRIWTPLPEQSRFGVFDTSKDLIEIFGRSLQSTQFLISPTIQWSDPFQEPKIIGNMTFRNDEYEGGNSLFIFRSRECGCWGSRSGARAVVF
ncbi:hypothetical protein F4679DRAFT_561044 [Xylaria curta]|nr:hypothetical protein F4679DRAFT_561044 [Xylaria curta]